MAIRYWNPGELPIGGGFRCIMMAAASGWSPPSEAYFSTLSNVNAPAWAGMFFQPSHLSRPGNRGSAYSGVWTGNISAAPLDTHTPLAFNRIVSLVAELRRVVRNQLLRT
jgi:hypothetical protein